ncbi:unnamed protein product [Mycena citricolor]|uniref:thioredoxin-dependent peroxiredoxin n=1 Tax=Mycena citricolor TaxID=2018698 RepID=A0AAD2Q286_9AGAR|nr:unnamed protein product [Mycena citricolor]
MVAQVQRPAPPFSATAVVDGVFEEVSLEGLLAKGKWVVLLFYPLDFTFVCPTEILAFNDALPAFDAIGAAVLGVSTDSHYAHHAWASQPRSQGGLGPGLRLPLLSDRSTKISRAYGVLVEEEGVALRGVFVVDPRGVVRQITINDLPVGRSVEETLRLVKAFQFTDKYGEVCPANWHEGGPTIKPDAKRSLEYFAAVEGNVPEGEVEGQPRPVKRQRVG